MRRISSSLGLTALIAAFAVGVQSEEARTREGEIQNNGFGKGTDFESAGFRVLGSSRRLQEPEKAPDPRLEELTETLSLSHHQQAVIHPAIIRVGEGYDPLELYLVYRESVPRLLGPAMTRADFEDALFAVLDVEQQLDYAADVTEKEAWWRSVVSRLEADLENQTVPSSQAPETKPSSSSVAPSSGRGRRLQLPPSPSTTEDQP